MCRRIWLLHRGVGRLQVAGLGVVQSIRRKGRREECQKMREAIMVPCAKPGNGSKPPVFGLSFLRHFLCDSLRQAIALHRPDHPAVRPG